MKKISIRVPEEIYNKLENEAHKKHKSISELVREILEKYLTEKLSTKRWKYYYLYKAPSSIINRALKHINDQNRDFVLLGYLRELIDTYNKAKSYCENEEELNTCKKLYLKSFEFLKSKIKDKSIISCIENNIR
jgi:hypothetical protein